MHQPDSFNLQQGGWEGLIFTGGSLFAALLGGVLLYRLLFSVLARLASSADISLNMILVDRMRSPTRLLLPLFALMTVVPSLSFPVGLLDVAQHIFSLSLIGLITWFVITLTLASRDIIISRYDIDARGSFEARAVYRKRFVHA